MSIIVQKYGGSVLSDISKIRSIAGKIADLQAEGNKVVAVVSAMGNTTDDLIMLANSVSLNPPKREMDMLLSVGERISMSLLAMAIYETGKAKAISYTGSQVGIITDNHHSDAKIVAIQCDRIKKALDDGFAVIVAGFQGVSFEKEITTLGRGGSDTTALAIAAALNADRCDLIKEVPGLFTGDPSLLPEAMRIPELDYASVKNLSLGGARILKDDCIDLAEKYGIEIRVGDAKYQSIIKKWTEKPFFSLALKENMILIKVKTRDYVKLDIDEKEVYYIGDEVYIALDKANAKNIKINNAEIIDNVSMITGVGENIGILLEKAYNDKYIKKIEVAYQNHKMMKIIFISDEPKEILKRLHTIFAGFFNDSAKCDGCQ